MDNNSILDNQLADELEPNRVAQEKIQEAAKWAKLLVGGLLLNTLLMVYQFVQMTLNSRYSYNRNDVNIGHIVTAVTSLGMIVFTFFAAYNLWSFANRALLGVEKNNNKIFAISIESLKAYFKFYGYFIIVVAILLAAIFFSMYFMYSRMGRYN